MAGARWLMPALLAVALCFPIVSAQCPNKPGYVTKADTNWVRSDKTQESQTRPDNAQQICNLDSNCLAWNNYGYYILARGGVAPTVAAAGIQFHSYEGMCTYVKATALPACPDKPGYVTKADTNWIRSDKTQESQTKPDSAEQICNLDSNCLAWNNYGYYILARGGVAPTVAAAGIQFHSYNEMCTYVKASAEQAKPMFTSDTGPAGPWASNMVVIRNLASKLCFASNDAQRLPLGMPRLLLSPCSVKDKSQAFKVVPVGKAYTIVDGKGRCVTSYTGLLIDSAALVPCGRNRADQLWSLASLGPNGKGPYTIKSKEAGACITNRRNSVTLDKCNVKDAIFEAASI